MIAAAAAPAAAGVLFGPPTNRTVAWWHLMGLSAVAACAAAALVGAGTAAAAGGLLAVLAVGCGVLAAGRVLVWAGQAGAGDPVWVASFAMAAASHAVLSAGRPTAAGEALAVGRDRGVDVPRGGGSSGAADPRRRMGRRPHARGPRAGPRHRRRRAGARLTLAGQWSALGIAGFAAAWKLTPLGVAVADTLHS